MAVGQLVSPDRWLLWLGVLFVLSVYHFPTGIVGRLRASVAIEAIAHEHQLPRSHYVTVRRPRAALHRVGRTSTPTW